MQRFRRRSPLDSTCPTPSPLPHAATPLRALAVRLAGADWQPLDPAGRDPAGLRLRAAARPVRRRPRPARHGPRVFVAVRTGAGRRRLVLGAQGFRLSPRARARAVRVPAAARGERHGAHGQDHGVRRERADDGARYGRLRDPHLHRDRDDREDRGRAQLHLARRAAAQPRPTRDRIRGHHDRRAGPDGRRAGAAHAHRGKRHGGAGLGAGRHRRTCAATTRRTC